MNFNRVILMGNLTRDIELRDAGGTPVGSFGLAINEKYRTKSGESREETVFVDCEAWGRTAEVMAQYLGKGRPVHIEGRLKLDQWTDRDGGKRSKLKVRVDKFEFVDGAAGGQSKPKATVYDGGHAPSMDADSIPF